MIRLDNVTKTYKESVKALADISLEIGKGEFVFVVGPSGSGKSTLIRLLLKEEEPTRGEIYVAGKNIGRLSPWKVPFLRRNLGTVDLRWAWRQVIERSTVLRTAFLWESLDEPIQGTFRICS